MEYLLQFEHNIVSKLAEFDILNAHFNNPISARITIVAILSLLLILINKLVFEIGLHFKLWDIDHETKEFFQDKLVHCAHLYVEARIKSGDQDSNKTLELNDDNLVKGTLNYHIEFGPEEYNEEDPELGTTLGFLKKKLYFLFKESEILRDHHDFDLITKNIKIDHVVIYKKNVKLTGDSTPLCILGVETGDKVQAEFLIDSN